ncbi:hypothetical protein [Jatrophihabitans sp.]|jgi:hypothetical protein|uniref:hypothetical protein n=1 Tax=Jatrophihabitans sp. TaxID=1932789 RepID=UPI002EE1EF80
MGTAEGKKARTDARELATTMPPDPYRGALSDPYAGRPGATPSPATQAGTGLSADSAGAGSALGLGSVPDYNHLPAGNRTPGPAVMAGILALGLAALLGLFGLLLLAIISLQDDYGAPDRSFYRGSDSSYLLLALLNFALGASLAIGGISFLTGRLVGRLVITIAGWTVLTVCGFWWLQAAVNGVVPLVMAAASLGMLVLSYQASVTRWLGVLPAAQPE